MIQALFAGVFVSVFCPIILALFRSAPQTETRLARGGPIVAMLLIAVPLLLTPAQFPSFSEFELLSWPRLIQRSAVQYVITIPMHEFGHFLFMPLGRTMRILGGSLFEVMLPLGMVLLFLRRRCPMLASCSLFLLGNHLIHVGQYMESARRPESTLLLSLDQNPANHDWHALFTLWGVLEQDQQIAAMTEAAGVIAVIIGIVFLIANSGARNPRADEPSGEEVSRAFRFVEESAKDE